MTATRRPASQRPNARLYTGEQTRPFLGDILRTSHIKFSLGSIIDGSSIMNWFSTQFIVWKLPSWINKNYSQSTWDFFDRAKIKCLAKKDCSDFKADLPKWHALIKSILMHKSGTFQYLTFQRNSNWIDLFFSIYWEIVILTHVLKSNSRNEIYCNIFLFYGTGRENSK